MRARALTSPLLLHDCLRRTRSRRSHQAPARLHQHSAQGDSILKAQDYPQAVPKVPVPLPLLYILKNSPGTAQGAFAAKDIQAGELIVAERPLLLSHRFGMRPSQFGEKEIEEEWEKQLKIALGRMNEEDQQWFKGLSVEGCGAPSSSSRVLTPLVDILKAHMVVLEDVFDGVAPAEREMMYGAIFRITSQMRRR